MLANWNVKEIFFYLYINDMAASDGIKLSCFKKILCTLLRSHLVQARHC